MAARTDRSSTLKLVLSMLLVCAAPLGCAKKESSSVPLTEARDGAAPDLGSADAEAADPDASDDSKDDAALLSRDLRALVRLREWKAVLAKLRAMPSDEAIRPENELLLSRALVENGKAKDATVILKKVGAELPLLGPEIDELRARAHFDAGDYESAGDLYAKTTRIEDRMRGALAYERADHVDRAEALLSTLLGHPKKTRRLEAEIRSRRLRLKLGSAARDAEDARWIVVHAPDTTFAKDASKVLARLSPNQPLTGEEEVARAKIFSESADVEEALAALTRAEESGIPKDRHERLRLRADVLIRNRTRLNDAVRWLDEARRVTNEHANEDALLAARTLSRVDRDDEAIERYLELDKKAPRTRFGEEALFLAARLHAIHHRWEKAKALLLDHEKRYAKGEHRSERRRYIALANLIEKRFKDARVQYEALSADETDPIDGGTFRYFAALAAYRDGDRTHATASWSALASERPFEWAGLLARLRLKADGNAKDPAAPLASHPSVPLPPPIDLLAKIGFDDEAERRLDVRDHEIEFSSKVDLACATYLQIDRAKTLFQVARRVPRAALLGEPTEAHATLVRCVYPTPFALTVLRRESANDVPHGLVHAVMRQESQFLPTAVSPARALGLMQVMPDTADRLLREHGKSLGEEDRLLDPDLNIALGAEYLRSMLVTFQDRVPLAVGAYNAGPDAVKRWRDRNKELETDVFVEQIPFTETRAYVMRVVGNFARYRALAEPADLDVGFALRD